jgi:hypothetical protein
MFRSELSHLILSSLVPEVTHHCRSFTKNGVLKASLSLPSVKQAIARGKPLIAGFGEVLLNRWVDMV